MERQRYRALLDKYGQRWTKRKPATGIYNCAGHVWASRRTSILDPQDWQVILRDDDYRLLNESEAPVPGDLVLYLDQANREALHVGRILGLSPGVASGAQEIPWVLSKWNSTSGEVMHSVHDVPYHSQGIPVAVEYWTDRPLS